MTQKSLEQLRKEKENWVTRIFWLGLEIAIIFAAPAALGVYAGKKIGGENTLSLILVGTFILSWTIVIIRFKQVSKKMKALEDAIKAHPDYTPTVISTSDDSSEES